MSDTGTPWKENSTGAHPSKYKVVLMFKGREISHRFYAESWLNLCEQIQDEYPGSKILSATGG